MGKIATPGDHPRDRRRAISPPAIALVPMPALIHMPERRKAAEAAFAKERYFLERRETMMTNTANTKYLAQTTELFKPYVEQDGRWVRNPHFPTNHRERMTARILSSLKDATPEDIEQARQHMETWTLIQLQNYLDILVSEGSAEPSDLLYARIEHPVAYDDGASVGAKALYMTLATFTYWPKRTCSPSLDTLRERLGTNRAHVVKWRNELVERGHIACEKGKGRSTNTYRLLHRNELAEAEKNRTEHRVGARIERREERKQQTRQREFIV